MSDLIVKGAGEIKDGLYNIKDGKLFQYKANGGTVRTYPIVSADRPKWIPVTERLAEFPCIIQDANGNNPSVPFGIVTVESKEHGTWQIDGKFWTDKDLNPYLNWHNRIIAWQPLPEAYREDEQ